MSAPADLQVCSSLDGVAPFVRGAVASALADLNGRGIDAVVYESLRTEALQEIYFARGASRASNVLESWHGFGAATDIISKARGWDVWPRRTPLGEVVGGDPMWYKPVVDALEAAGMAWGGHWIGFPDWPHFQWAKCKVSPSDEARILYASGGLTAVWAAIGAT